MVVLIFGSFLCRAVCNLNYFKAFLVRSGSVCHIPRRRALRSIEMPDAELVGALDSPTHGRRKNRLLIEAGINRLRMAVDVGVATTALLVRAEALRHHQTQLVLGAGHRGIEQAALFLDVLG